MRLTLQKSDSIGVLASTLCMIHCFATPFIFIAQTCSASCCQTAPNWWRWVDYFFLVISFFAVYRSTQTTSKKWIKIFFWINWGCLFIVILNERIEFIHLPKKVTYIVASTLVIIHLYNKRYCQCKTDKCCTNKKTYN